MKAFVREIGLHKAVLRGCAYGLKDRKGNFLKRPWAIASTSSIVIDGLGRNGDGARARTAPGSGGGLVGETNAPGRQIDEKGLAAHVVKRNESPITAVLAITAVIPQDEIVPLRHRELTPPDAVGAALRGNVPVVDILYDLGLDDWLTVDNDIAVSYLQRFPGKPDQPLDEILVLGTQGLRLTVGALPGLAPFEIEIASAAPTMVRNAFSKAAAAAGGTLTLCDNDLIALSTSCAGPPASRC